jgi:hypothetical protein
MLINPKKKVYKYILIDPRTDSPCWRGDDSEEALEQLFLLAEEQVGKDAAVTVHAVKMGTVCAMTLYYKKIRGFLYGMTLEEWTKLGMPPNIVRSADFKKRAH